MSGPDIAEDERAPAPYSHPPTSPADREDGSDLPTTMAQAARFKHDPESLALRAAPTRTARFRKGALMTAAAGAFVLLAGLAWIALDPAGLTLAAGGHDLAPASDETVPEAVGALPAGYGTDAPPLGPPLPGDLGRPILAQQRAMAGEEGVVEPVQPATDPASGAAAEQQRLEAEMAAARGAPVLMQISPSAPRVTGGASEPAAGPSPASAGSSTADFINPNRLQLPASRWRVSAGSTIAASLITGINSDLPGLVVAQVTEPVFDSATGRAILIPQGARLLGRYDSKIAFGQRRALLIWERLVMPDGASIDLDNAPATDPAGFAGLADRVDFHTWQLLKGIGLSTLLGLGTELSFGEGEADLVRALRESTQSNADRAGQKIVERNLDIAPTITVRPGAPVRVLLHKDLILRPWRG